MCVCARNAGTPQWKAPDVIRGENATKESDVYGFGIVLWEIAARQIPFAERYKFAHAVEDAVVRGERPDAAAAQASSPPAGWLELAARCWADAASTRPPFAAVHASLCALADPAVETSSDGAVSRADSTSPRSDSISPRSGASAWRRVVPGETLIAKK